MRVNVIINTLLTLMLASLILGCDKMEGDLASSDENINPEFENPDGDLSEDYGLMPVKLEQNVQTWSVPATGQKKCYGLDGEIPCPRLGEAFFGQDGSYQFGVRSYQDNADATVTDLVTGLTWQVGYKGDVSWYGAKNYCETLTLNGDKWRLPDTHEIRSLVDYGTADPAIDTTAFPDTPSEWFWGSKAVGLDNIGLGLESSWIVNFYDGFVEYTSRNNLYNVRCVKAN